jgi:hypothetical protein
MASFDLAVTEREQRLMDLLKRLLGLYEQQRRRLAQLESLLERLGATSHVLQGRLERSETDRAIENTTTDVVIGAALDELLERTTDS